MTMNELAPSVVRKIILDEHNQLRTQLLQLKTLMQSKESVKIRNAMHELIYYFLKHIENEEKILRPVLKDVDAWGSVRVDRMNQEHAAQKLEIEHLDQLLATGKPELYFAPIENFMKELYKDMEAEEREALSPELLKDDPITSGTCS